ncbi:MAG: ketoacyl-ACP synthase III [Planctomycetes bacterium]|nr:ketoacyl-ACP synthase III [Planctomycetota bacterium]
MKRTRILGTGRYLPERVVTNDEMAKLMPTSDEWIQQRSGIKQRRFVAPGQGPAEIGTYAAQAALDAAGLKPSDLDFIICATQTPEHQFPGTACFLQKRLDAPGIGALDIRDQCTGFLYGLSVADAFIRLGVYRRILLVGTEVNSTGMDLSDRSRHLSVLFGDGAGAVVLGESESPDCGILSVHLHADGRFAEELWVPAPGSVYQPRITHQMLDEGLHYARMNGKAVFKEAVTNMVSAIKEVLAQNAMTIDDITFFIPHQANMRINEAVGQMIGIAPDKVDHSIQRYGNCAAASVPIALDERVRAGQFKPGDRILFSTFAAGFTWGSAVLKW